MLWLLAAEADQIQDLIFRASRLREVVGGSQLLSRFCREDAPELLRQRKYPAKIIVNDGGAFRIRFEDRNEAETFGRDLAELYRRVAGGNLTVAEPVHWGGAFKAASALAQRALRDAKSSGDEPAAAEHLPYIAFCASCGVSLAASHEARHGDDRPNYLCRDCQGKTRERDDEAGGFLDLFEQEVGSKLPWPANRDWQEAISKLDLSGRRFVAYLLADGNGMGRTFSQCPDEATMEKLSRALPGVVRASLAVPCRDLLRRIEEAGLKRVLPVVPLILGGDDLFALAPASWSLDLARRFCSEYENRMAGKMKELGLEDRIPTISVAVVICKSNYPHTLAHQAGEKLLRQAKRLARGVEADPTPERRRLASVIQMRVIAAHEVGGREESSGSRRRLSAGPYFPEDVEQLVKQRLELTELPAKRRAEFEKLYHEVTRTDDPVAARERWDRGCEYLLGRIGSQAATAVERALAALGGPAGARGQEGMKYWKWVDHPPTRTRTGPAGSRTCWSFGTTLTT
jgi:hypothetical protein